MIPAGASDERPFGIDLFCGLGGWTQGLIADAAPAKEPA